MASQSRQGRHSLGWGVTIEAMPSVPQYHCARTSTSSPYVITRTRGFRSWLALSTASGEGEGVQGVAEGWERQLGVHAPQNSSVTRAAERAGGGHACMHVGGVIVLCCEWMQAPLPLPHCTPSTVRHCQEPRSKAEWSREQQQQQQQRGAARPAPPPPAHPFVAELLIWLLCMLQWLPQLPHCPPTMSPGSKAASRGAGRAGSSPPTAAAGTRRPKAHARQPAQPASQQQQEG